MKPEDCITFVYKDKSLDDIMIHIIKYQRERTQGVYDKTPEEVVRIINPKEYSSELKASVEETRELTRLQDRAREIGVVLKRYLDMAYAGFEELPRLPYWRIKRVVERCNNTRRWEFRILL